MSVSIPSSMTAIEIPSPGGPEALVACTRPVPQPSASQVLVKVHAAGVNRPDVMQRQGMYPPPPGASDIPGLEIAGEIVTVGSDAKDLSVGDRVCALVTGGGYAEYCVAESRLCLPYPRNYDAVRAAALPETFFTVWTNVFDRGRLERGERILVHGGSSGIGTTAIQLANAFGATVYATAGSARKCEACVELGAAAAINYRKEDFVERIQSLTDGAGVDLVLDMVMGDYLERDLQILAPEGRLVFIAVQGGPKVKDFNVLPIMLKRLTVTGSTLRPRSVQQKAIIRDALAEQVWPLLDAGTVAPVMQQTFALENACDAHALMDSGDHIGKIVLTTS